MQWPSLTLWASSVNRLAPALLDIALRSVVILALASLLTLAMRRASAAARHWVWLLAVAGLLLLPVLSATLPAWHVLPRLGMFDASLAQTAPLPSAMVATLSLPDPAVPPQNPVPSEEPLAIARNESATPGQQDSLPAPAAATAQPAPAALGAPVETPTATQTPPSIPLPWPSYLLLLWLGGCLLVLGQMLLGFLSLWSLRRRCVPITHGTWSELLHHLRQLLKVHRPVELLSSPQRSMPMTWGLWRTQLLLPTQAAAWPPEQRRAVLLHELGHAKRWDCLTQFLAQIACALYWFNPAMWFAWRRMQIERERACDDLVLNTGAKASTYAEHLLHTASALPTLRFVGAAIAMARPSTLEERLRAILDPQRNRRALSTWSALATFLLLIAAIMPVAALQAQQNPARALAAASGPPPVPGYPADGTVPLPPGYSATRPIASTPLPPASAEDIAARMDARRQAQLAAAMSTPTTGPASTAPAGRSSARSGGGGRGAQVPEVPPTPGQGPTCALDATIYDLRLPPDQIARLDLDALTKAAATPEAFERALAELGTTHPLYRANQSVRLSGESILIGNQTPYITSSNVTPSGQTINSVAYSQTGARFNIAGKAGASGNVELDLSIQVSSLSESATPIATNVNAAVFRNATMARKGPVEARRPFVVVSVDAATRDENGLAVACIARVTLGAPQSGN